ncbi:uncharacterized protein FFNC_03515 [Fusarium fujikuroi]|nr:uncharacterized protein FFE2_04616 [Fusarium fujikuroi]SCN85766.1 uncharacterized protein FFC1_04976 [Fusarium fujikuroi]SCO33914.1 uncharacterized protein FFNC_03515 [Fusarium fujikuroi]
MSEDVENSLRYIRRGSSYLGYAHVFASHDNTVDAESNEAHLRSKFVKTEAYQSGNGLRPRGLSSASEKYVRTLRGLQIFLNVGKDCL